MRKLSSLLFCLIELALGVGLFLPANSIAAEDTSAAFDAANLLYEKGQYESAARAYEALIAQGVRTSAVLFNAGDARFKSGQIGLAVAHWLEAQAIDPRNDRIQINLDFARKEINGGTLPTTHWPVQLRLLTLNEWALLVLLSTWLFFGGLAIATWKPKTRAFLRLPIGLGGFVMVASLVLTIITIRDRSASTVAVVIVDESVVRYGPLEESQSAFVARDGTELRVTDRKDEWLKVEDAAGREGWLPGKQVIELRGGRVLNDAATIDDRGRARIANLSRPPLSNS